MEDKKYNSVILAALMHDVGKAVQGSNHAFAVSREYYGHPGISGRLLDKLFKEKVLDDSFFDAGLAVMLAANHHDRDIKQSAETLGSSLPLAALVSVADSYSSRERDAIDKDKMGKGNPRLKALLASVFSMVESKGKTTYYRVAPLRKGNDSGNLIPLEAEDNSGIVANYDEILQGFIESLKKIKKTSAFDYLASVQGAIEEYFWAVPSVTIADTNDICLYDHMKVSAAIAAAMYLYHSENLTLGNETAIRSEKEDKFIFVAGDITGIQDFIFDINTLNAKGLSKELRGRSFLVSLAGSLISLKILNELKLPLACRIIDAGGKFVILAPNTENTRSVLGRVYSEVVSETIGAFGGSLLPVVDWSQSMSAEAFGDMKNVLKRIEKSIGAAKLRKISGGKAYYGCYRLEKEYSDFVDSGKCPSCGVRPAVINNGASCDCRICGIAKSIGGKIASADISFINYGTCGAGFSITDSGFTLYGIEVSFADARRNDSFYSERVRDGGTDTSFAAFRDISNHVPVSAGRIDTETQSGDYKEGTLCRYCQDPCGTLAERKGINHSGMLTFQCISSATPMANRGGSTGQLAVVKGDVDDLGYIFSEGLGNKLSMSKYVSLSRMINTFFSVYLKDLLKRKYRDMYTVYAGGDDFLLIGPWEEAIEAAGAIREEFDKFTGKNPFITLSAGISMFKPHQPVLAAVNEAESMLEKAKARDKKDGICIFGSAISWQELRGPVTDIKNTLSKHMAESGLPMAGMYRLLSYYRMYEGYRDTGQVELLKYDYLMSYDIRRNYKDEVLAQALFALKDEEKMSLMKIPLHWVIYKNRNKRGGKDA